MIKPIHPSIDNQFVQDYIRKQDELMAFMLSDTYKEMVQSLKDKKTTVSDDSFHYTEDASRQSSGWLNQSMDDIKMFFKAVSHTLPVDSWLKDDDFPTSLFMKDGLRVVVMMGQGTLVIVSSDSDNWA